MSEILRAEYYPLLIPLLVALVVLVAWLVYRYRTGRKAPLEAVLDAISVERMTSVVVPNGDEGEILIDHLLLTSKGLLILDIRDVQGVVFGGDRLKEWSVISDDRRYTLSNPQTMLYDRIAAISDVVRQIPVTGRILFLEGAEFTKGVPELVTTLEELEKEFGEPDENEMHYKVEAFKPYWDAIRKYAIS